jgi:HlyD family secretion protein
MLLGIALVWGFTGSLESKATARGIIVRTGGVQNVVAPAAGTLVSLDVNVGERIRARQVIGKILQPEQLQQIRSTEQALEEARRHGRISTERRRDSAKLQVAAIERQRSDILRQITDLESQAKLAEDHIPVVEQLLGKGLVTRQAVIDAKQKLVDLQSRNAALKTQLTQLDAQEFLAKNQPLEADADLDVRISDLERTLAGYQKELELTSNIVSPYDGEVIELKAYSGGRVTAGSPLLSLQSDADELQLLVYLPAAQGKDAKPNMTVQISPSTVRREEYGFMRGKVIYVSDFPATPAALMRNFQNEALVSELTKDGPVTELRVSMTRNPLTHSGYDWSSRTGPPIIVTSGSICEANIITREQKPITLLFPYIKGSLGVS